MTPEDFKLLGLLPGLYYSRDELNLRIAEIEARLHNSSAKNVNSEIVPNLKRSAKQSEGLKNYWANLTPRKRKLRIEAMKASRIAKRLAQKDL